MGKLKIANGNNKHGCRFFIHITAAPVNGISVTEYMVDNGVEPDFRVKLVRLVRCALQDLPEIWVMLSHGVSYEDFARDYLARNEAADWKTEMGVYLFERVGN